MDQQVSHGPRWGRIVAVVLLVLLIALLWGQRTPVATSFVNDALARKGVSARYEITRFGIDSQTLENISIGDPAAPDLTARSAVLRLSVGIGGATVRSIVARGVRLHGRVVNGKVSLGAIDRLLPPPTGAPFTLPDLTVELSDARMRLDTPAGVVGMALEGQGNLSDGFQGRMAAVMRSVQLTGCTAERATAFVNIAIAERKPTLDGPVRAVRLHCPKAGVVILAPRIAVDIALNEALTEWKGGAVIETGAARLAAKRAASLGGRIGFDGTAARVRGDLGLFANRLATPSLAARRASIDGRYALRPADGEAGLIGEAQVTAASVTGTMRALRTAVASTQGTPLAPVGRAIGDALARAGMQVHGRATIALVQRKVGGAIRFERIDVNSASGARLVARSAPGRGGITYYWPQEMSRIDGDLLLAGGGLPGVRASLRQPSAILPIEGVATIASYSAGESRIMLTPVRFGAGGGGRTRFETRFTIDGPIGDGRIQGLSLPVRGTIGGYGSFAINDRCQPLDFSRLQVAGMDIGHSRLPLCPVGGALLSRSAGGLLSGGAQIAAPRLIGRIGALPLLVTAHSLGVAIGQPGFVGDSIAVRLGQPAAMTRLDIMQLQGDFAAGGVGGRFNGLSGNIGNVPLLMTQGNGDWRLVSGVLTLGGQMQVADRAPAPRFEPLIANDMRLRLGDGIVTARGWLRNPASQVEVTEVTLRHDLASGRGNAILDVPGITFGDALQPEGLTGLTLGVVANVKGMLKGRGEVRWTPDAVSSDGRFETEGLDLAAAFGPVSRLKGTIHFTDLLSMETKPGESVTIGEINTGVAVNDGLVRYQLLPGQRVRIEGGRWPFSGGELVLDETILDFARPSERRLTFRVVGMDAAQFVQQFDFKNIAVTGTFDGILPMIFDVNGGRIVGGRMVVRRGGGKLAYVGEVSNADLGMFGKLAFDALKSIRYDNLAIELNGSLDGEIVSKVIFTGINEAPLDGSKPPVGMLQSLTGLPFRFNITIRAPFRGLINSAQSLTDPRGLISRSIGQEVELPGSAPVQTEESERVP